MIDMKVQKFQVVPKDWDVWFLHIINPSKVIEIILQQVEMKKKNVDFGRYSNYNYMQS